ncbi:ABC transporter ATP-binding protein [Peribacillus cavernae]|uniref:ABC transporter ATP-binding protein n=1 Tax=Peribacillus cavernae TaxID=1674310 RepID=A0A3S0U191_9BACI|nr:ABC transporter ATP-binding protein [Peribacillus cavernae]MDQ0220299.1 ABC-2 type transport system ATP-binding protein [Peribacillus cavernae]RUQ31958.1 ABC transporter ATP-binding protein [Peribacillus cavernae]
MVLLDVSIKLAGYEAEKSVISDIAFELNPGELIGVIGPNGAGKSTTIKTLLGLIEHWKGKVFFQDGASYTYIPERPIFYDELTLQEHIDFIAAVEEVDSEILQERSSYYLKNFRMDQHIHELPATYSKGMQQKAMLILALITSPDIYIIDEPFIGLDPDAMKLLLTTIEREKERGAGILMSTHVLDTAERVCDRFLLIIGGELKAGGTLEEIRVSSGRPEGTLYDCYHAINGYINE